MEFVTFLSQLFGNGEETGHKLRSAGYTTPERLSGLTPEELSTVTGLSVSHSKRMINYAREILQEGKEEPKDRLVEIEGVGDRRAKILRGAGLHTVEAVAGAQEENLAKMLKVPKSTASKIIESAREVGGYVQSTGVIAKETDVLTTQVLPQESSKKEEPKAYGRLVKSFWKFG